MKYKVGDTVTIKDDGNRNQSDHGFKKGDKVLIIEIEEDYYIADLEGDEWSIYDNDII